RDREIGDQNAGDARHDDCYPLEASSSSAEAAPACGRCVSANDDASGSIAPHRIALPPGRASLFCTVAAWVTQPADTGGGRRGWWPGEGGGRAPAGGGVGG